MASGEPNALKDARSVREECSWLININEPVARFAWNVAGSSPVTPALRALGKFPKSLCL